MNPTMLMIFVLEHLMYCTEKSYSKSIKCRTREKMTINTLFCTRLCAMCSKMAVRLSLLVRDVVVQNELLHMPIKRCKQMRRKVGQPLRDLNALPLSVFFLFLCVIHRIYTHLIFSFFIADFYVLILEFVLAYPLNVVSLLSKLGAAHLFA